MDKAMTRDKSSQAVLNSLMFDLDLVAMSVFGLKLHMVVITKALLSLYNIEISTIHEAKNAKEMCVFENSASGGPFFSTILYNMPFFLS